MATLAMALSETTPTTIPGETHRLLRGQHHHHGHRGHHQKTCDKYPGVCRSTGSGGPDCCKKKCVDVSSDRNNCGKCGKKCKYSQMCCKGKCVSTMSSNSHCGRCDNRCLHGDSCVYGICSYAN
ncbi:stigma-specific STIG1-like protein 1 [Senna tora]|uniref:Stigma-specific STIG1-like protein 1 n=1 Tax=Senna tora TaxID=362788 RepID=A0A835CIR2_9FABA|nr:stigma-specific STIG1-like protein 1 [Senna tora]